MITILGLESSCDETSASVVQDGKILTNIISSQTIHELYGGVVPEIASRAHQRNIVTVVEQALNEANIDKKELNAIAFTQGPGLIGSLLVASSFAKGLAMALEIPLIGINHLHAHVLANFAGVENPQFPFLCLLVSGGHTQIIVMNSHLDYEIIGQSIDDAAGEAFDKAAKIIELPYPGGPALNQMADTGNIHSFKFTKPKIPGYNFSFSGLKTQFLYTIRDHLKNNQNFIMENIHDLCASYQHVIVEYLLGKVEMAAKEYKINQIAIAGGVAANTYLRRQLQTRAIKNNWKIFIPDFQFCTDNAAMVALTGYFMFLEGKTNNQMISNFARL